MTDDDLIQVASYEAEQDRRIDRNRAMQLIDAIKQLRARVAELEAIVPKCACCGKPAACIGRYEGHVGFACDDCCGHGNEDGVCFPIVDAAQKWDSAIAQSHAALERVAELEAVVAKLPRTADGVPVVQISGEHVWRPRGPEGRSQRSSYFQNGLAVFRGWVHDELEPIGNCYSTREAAEAAKAGGGA